jgi:hypothetical protein
MGIWGWRMGRRAECRGARQVFGAARVIAAMRDQTGADFAPLKNPLEGQIPSTSCAAYRAYGSTGPPVWATWLMIRWTMTTWT